MRILQYIGVRIILGFVLSNMVFSLVDPDMENTFLVILLRLVVAGVFYYMLTVYVNSRKKL
ncbi:hypothetical protein ACFO3U_07750 [Flavobacterium ponti]|jgi:hypothetical protein|uniref:Uncharacterized protein n=1 Tax=Flavobacterium ponti TaxID=665133 RepID=A0ABV9P4S0_9FLAO